MKEDERLGRNYIRGVAGDEINAVLAGSGHNIRKLLRGIVSRLLVWMMITSDSRPDWA